MKQHDGSEPRGRSVAELLALIDFRAPERDHFNWRAVESSIGITLPEDYKELVEVLPPGYFQEFAQIIRPGDVGASRDEFLGYYAHRLEDMRRWREDDPRHFPLPIFPEPGGLLPWGRSIRSDLFFWLTEGEDPTAWPIVLAEREFTHWESFSGSVTDFLIDVVTGRFDGHPFGVNLRAESSRFQTIESLITPPPEPSTENYWAERNRGNDQPQNVLDELCNLAGSPQLITASVDWKIVEQGLGFSLPADYVTFIDTYGPGQFGDITIASPVGNGDGLEHLIDKVNAEAAANPRRRPERHPPIHPESDGMIPWGETPDGWACCWAPSTPNPDNWGVVVLSPQRINCGYSPDLSFSSFLVKYATLDQVGLFLGRALDPPYPMEFTAR